MKPLIITPRIEEILRTIHFYRYMTALDVTHLLYKRGALTHARDILKVLCGTDDYIDHQYLFRFPLPQFTSGKTEKVFTLGSRGRDYLVREAGTPVNWYFRPSQVRHLSHGIINHNLTLTRFLVCATEVWTRRPFAPDESKGAYFGNPQRLLGQPVQLVLRAVGGLGDAHLRDGHLRHVHESLTPWWRATAAVLTVASK